MILPLAPSSLFDTPLWFPELTIGKLSDGDLDLLYVCRDSPARPELIEN
jgi:hypothetical protein